MLSFLGVFEPNGWLGNWSPGIGDPSWVGWCTVVLYFAAALTSARVLRSEAPLPAKERRFWLLLTAALVVLGLNKQLDLQTAFTEVGRMLAREQGWYESRGVAQRILIGVIVLASAALVAFLLVVLRGSPRPTRLAAVGVVLLLCFIVIRASSFHHVDLLLGRELLGVRWNWLLEVGSVSLVAWSGHQRRAFAGAESGPRRARVVRATK